MLGQENFNSVNNAYSIAIYSTAIHKTNTAGVAIRYGA